jgi:hypothetical protein
MRIAARAVKSSSGEKDQTEETKKEQNTKANAEANKKYRARRFVDLLEVDAS